MSISVKRIETIYLPTTNTAKSANWYMSNFNLTLLRPVNDDQAQLGLESGQSLFLIRTKEATNLTFDEINGSEQCVMTLEVTNLTDLHKRLREQGVSVTDIEDHDDCGMNFYVYDPTGNKIDIWGGWTQRSYREDIHKQTIIV